MSKKDIDYSDEECDHLNVSEEYGTYVCNDCGEELDYYVNSVTQYEDNSFKNISYSLKTETSAKTHYINEYSSDKQTSKHRTEIVNLINECLAAAQENVPEEEVCKTAELFLEIKSVNKCIIKTKNKYGTLGACLLLVCNSIGQYRKLSEIRKIFNIKHDKYILANLQNIYILRDTTGITLPENARSLDEICMRTMIRESDNTALIKYEDFAIDILKRVNSTLIRHLYNFKVETVVNGILNIVDKSFQKKYFTQVLNKHYPVIRDIYVNHKILMPMEWYARAKTDNILIVN